MSEMVERVAREIAMEIMEIFTPGEVAAFKWPDDASGDTIDRARSRARRVIAAMREPTEAMRFDGYHAAKARQPHTPVVLGQLAAAYAAMIDAALAEP